MYFIEIFFRVTIMNNGKYLSKVREQARTYGKSRLKKGVYKKPPTDTGSAGGINFKRLPRSGEVVGLSLIYCNWNFNDVVFSVVLIWMKYNPLCRSLTSIVPEFTLERTNTFLPERS